MAEDKYSAEALLAKEKEVELDTDDVKEENVQVEEKTEEKKEPNLNLGEVDLGYTDHSKQEEKSDKPEIEVTEDKPQETSVEEKTETKEKEEEKPNLQESRRDYQKRIDKRKTEKGKGRQRDKLDALLKFFSPQNKQSLENMFELQKQLVFAKLKLINRLNSISNIDAFVKTKKGYKTTGAEGYVAIDKLTGGAVKLVDRLEFSYNNFSPDILKGWDKPK